MESEHRTATSSIEAELHDLRALLSEINTQRQLVPEEHKEITDRIKLEIQRCENESKLLANTVNDLPETVMDMLTSIAEDGIDDQEWDNGFSPMHWAARAGRRDIIEYLRRQEGGDELLATPDNNGKTPLFYAEKHRSLLAWLREEAGVTAPAVKPLMAMPDISFLAPNYRAVLERITEQGWASVPSWKDGFTMLHWAAREGHAELCEYLVHLQADANAQDISGRTPLDIALKAGHSELQPKLQELGVKSTIMLASYPGRDGSLSSEPGGRRALQAPRDARETQFTVFSDLASLRSDSSTSTATDAIPAYYGQVMENIERHGWHNMNWKHEFTLLHWAAQHNNAKLIARFLEKNADPEHVDGTGKSALDYAREQNAEKALQALTNPMLVSHESRHSMQAVPRSAVHAQLPSVPSETRLGLEDEQ
eukprot:NODE_8979_length_1455_cov_3.017319.p1 GENE.NODE_8979_length_1455_cov_3.017319~~NODE_8979_length_1455_cov_3.017319.p1  ORF type:complete len:424 (-),score=112.67 NODE_8979_length_1455_cov_3.017319:39-1310(-)